MNTANAEINDVYFRRLFVPIIIAILIFAGVFVIITASAGTPPAWDATNSVFGTRLARN
jgi:hypothetical protein